MTPNTSEFLEFMRNEPIELSEYQKELAATLIHYRVKHLSGGLRRGRTTVIRAVQDYFKKMYPNYKDAGREI
jgi:hypothetical protein